MLSTTFLTIGALAAGVNAHFRLLQPIWRGSSFEEPASQWIYPCANVNETTDIANRTLWPPSGGSLVINGTHQHALTAINLALGSNATNFNISLVDMFNQTGIGLFCLKETGRANLEQGFKDAGYSGLNDSRIEGLQASVQVIQLGSSGSALYNCADIQFNSTAQLLSDDQCQNSTGVGGVAIENVDANSDSPTASGSAAPTESSGAASVLSPAIGSGLLAGLLTWGLL
ncbi:Nn.00g083880.m01.CDS01 [Neocucurbitaria sp. VM-36]